MAMIAVMPLPIAGIIKTMNPTRIALNASGRCMNIDLIYKLIDHGVGQFSDMLINVILFLALPDSICRTSDQCP
jgi:hypothetical protein